MRPQPKSPPDSISPAYHPATVDAPDKIFRRSEVGGNIIVTMIERPGEYCTRIVGDDSAVAYLNLPRLTYSDGEAIELHEYVVLRLTLDALRTEIRIAWQSIHGQ